MWPQEIAYACEQKRNHIVVLYGPELTRILSHVQHNCDLELAKTKVIQLIKIEIVYFFNAVNRRLFVHYT